MLPDSRTYFTFGNHICSFTSMTTYPFLVWPTFLFFHSCQWPLKFYTHVHPHTTIMPMKCYVTCSNILHLATIYFPSCLWSLKYPFLAATFVFANVYEVLNEILKYLTFWQPNWFYHIYDQLGILCWKDIFVFPSLCQYLLKYYIHVYLYTMLISVKY